MFLALLFLANQLTAQDPPRPGVVTFEEAIRVVDTISLQETPEVVNVSLEVALDPALGSARDSGLGPDGGLIVADQQEGQARIYDAEGGLLWYGGGKGEGPGEFQNLRLARRLGDGSLLCSDRNARFTLFDTGKDTLIGTVSTPFFHVEDVEVRDGASVWVTAMLEGNQLGPRIHLWDLERGAVTGSFFSPFATAPNPSVATFAGWTKMTVRSDSLAAIFAASDTVYVFAEDGAPARKMPLPSTQYRPVPQESPTGRLSPEEQAQWLASFDLLADVWWLDSGTILVQYLSILPDPRLSERAWHLVAMSPSGELIAEVRDLTRILAVDEASGRMYMQAPGSVMPGDWIVGEPVAW